MALTSCPECSREISDQVKACPHCGYPLASPANSTEQKPQPNEEIPLNCETSKKRKNVILTVIVIVFIAIIAVALTFLYRTNQKAKAEAEAIRTTYLENLNLLRAAILPGAISSESLCNLTYAVWYNTIYQVKDSETDKYTTFSSGYLHSDFNTSLDVLYSDESIKTTIADIKSNQATVAELMKELQNPTEEFKVCYDTTNDMFESYQSLTELAINPSGNLTTYYANFQTYDTELGKYYKKLETQIPEQ